MKAERYLLEYVLEHHLSLQVIKENTGINIQEVVSEKRDLVADEFLSLCAYLHVTPEEISDQIL